VPDRVTFSFGGREIVTLAWFAPWAISVLHDADYYELDCSFMALKPYIYSIPLAIKANVGIPLGIVIAPSERREIYSIFSHLLAEKGFSRESLFELPLLSDAGTALRSYAKGGSEREGYHRRHYLCYRHLLESLGSGTLVALLARRLLFTNTEKGFRELHPQTLAGVDLVQLHGNKCLSTSVKVFKAQALWGERGIDFGVASCTNHIEGLHGRVNRRVLNLRILIRRFALITSAIVKSAASWSQKVERGWNTTKKKLKVIAEKNELTFDDCPEWAHCDRGRILSRRLGRPVPCVHIISKGGWPEHPSLTQFNLFMTGEPDIGFTDFEGQWTPASGKKSHLRKFDDEMNNVGLEAETSPDVRTVARVRREVISLNPDFKVSLNEMLIRFGQIQGRLGATLASSLTEGEINQRANSMLLVEYVQVGKNQKPWPR
jgi:hypothetical protein